jgi:hypothetical protein
VKDALEPMRGWAGTWTGEAELEDGTSARVRVVIAPAVEGHALSFHIEVWLDGEVLVDAARLILGPAGDELGAVCWSSRYGMMVMRPTPDDEGVLALAGEMEAGGVLAVSFVPGEDEELLMTSAKRQPEAAGGAHEMALARLYRRVPWKPPMP